MIRRWPLTLRGTGAVVLAVGCLVLAHELGAAELLFLGCLLVALVVACSIALRVGRRSGEVVRSLHPSTVAVGRESEVDVAVIVGSVVPTSAGSWRDTLPSGLSGRARGQLPALGRGEAERPVRLSYSVSGLRRGVHEIGPLSLTVSDPFGIARRTRSTGGVTRVLVVPATDDLDSVGEFGGDLGGTTSTTTDSVGQGADNLIARPYAPGDSMRRIHWRATAHRDQLMVREEEQESTPEATVVLDLSGIRWPAGARTAPGASAEFERALSACASIVRRLALDGYTVEVLDATGRPLAAPVGAARDDSDCDEMLSALATVLAERDDHLGELSPLFTGGSTGPVVVITGALSEADAAVIAPVAHHSALPVLLTTHADPHALDAAASAGWHTGALPHDGALADVWADAAGRDSAVPGAGHVFA